MTIEEIKQYIKDQLDSIEKSTAWMCGDEFEYGEYSAYSNCLDILEDIESPWHEYPAENPPKSGEYEVTRYDGKVDVYSYNRDGEFQDYTSWDGIPKNKYVIAWKEFSNPYVEENDR